MKLLSGWLPALVALLGFTNVARADCENELVAELQLKIVGNEVLIPTSIGDKEVYLALRGNSGVPYLWQAGVDWLGIKATPQNGTGNFKSNEGRVTHVAKLENLRIGDFRMAGRTALVSPNARDDELFMVDGRPMVGVMGSTLFQYMDIELDLGHERMKVFRPFKCRKRSPVYWDQSALPRLMRFDAVGMLVFTVELEGRRVESSLLSGDSYSSIDVNATRRFFGFDGSSPGVEGGELFHAMSLTGGGLKVADARVRLRKGLDCKLAESVPVYHAIGYADCLNVVPFTVGIDVLKRLRVYTSREREQIYFTQVAAD